MKEKEHSKLYFFVDESGDPYFYNRDGQCVVGKEGCSKILIIGLIKTEEPDHLRKAIGSLKEEIQKDEYLKDIPSFPRSVQSFHATDDIPEIRERVYKAIKGLNFKSEFVVARKKESVFISRHKKKPNIFYDDIVSKLFENQLHKSEENVIYFSVRGNRARQEPVEDAIHTAILAFEEKWKTKVNTEIRVYPQRPEGEPCLQIIDYMNWAVQRAFVRGEMRYFNFIKEKISLIVDIYDFDAYPKNYYNRGNPLDVKKISPL